jgi:hypothetical protein
VLFRSPQNPKTPNAEEYIQIKYKELMNDSHRSSSNGHPGGVTMNNVNQASSSGVEGSGSIYQNEPTPKGRENGKIGQET